MCGQHELDSIRYSKIKSLQEVGMGGELEGGLEKVKEKHRGEYVTTDKIYCKCI